jgi:hypothetical protein
MHKSPAKLIPLSFCLQGLTLVPALAQAVVLADGRVGVPMGHLERVHNWCPLEEKLSSISTGLRQTTVIVKPL